MIKNLFDSLSLFSIIVPILQYWAFYYFTRRGKAQIYSKIQNLLDNNEKILYALPPKITPIVVMIVIISQCSTLLMVITVLLTSLTGKIDEFTLITSFIIVNCIIFAILVFDNYLNGSLSKLVITNQRMLYSNIKENKTPKSVYFAEIKLIDTFRNRGFEKLIIERHEGRAINIDIPFNMNAHSIKEQIDKLIVAPSDKLIFSSDEIKKQTLQKEKEWVLLLIGIVLTIFFVFLLIKFHFIN